MKASATRTTKVSPLERGIAGSCFSNNNDKGCVPTKMKRAIIPYNKDLKTLAKNLRNNSTLGEILLWKQLSGKQFYGFDFHRQKPLLNYIADFYCSELKLVIEVDGKYHNEELTSEIDHLRDNDLAAYGLTILRFTEDETKTQMFNVLLSIEQHISMVTSNLNKMR